MNPYREEKIFDIVKKLRLAEKEITDNASIDVMDLHFITGILFCHSSLEKGKNLRLSHLAPISFKKADAKRIREAFEECGFRNHIVIHTTLTHADITVITDILRYYNRDTLPDMVGVYANGAFHPMKKKIIAFQTLDMPYAENRIGELLNKHPYIAICSKLEPVLASDLATGKTFSTDYLKVVIWGEFYATDLDTEDILSQIMLDAKGCVNELSDVAAEKLNNGMNPYMLFENMYLSRYQWEEIVLADIGDKIVRFY